MCVCVCVCVCVCGGLLSQSFSSFFVSKEKLTRWNENGNGILVLALTALPDDKAAGHATVLDNLLGVGARHAGVDVPPVAMRKKKK